MEGMGSVRRRRRKRKSKSNLRFLGDAGRILPNADTAGGLARMYLFSSSTLRQIKPYIALHWRDTGHKALCPVSWGEELADREVIFC